MEVPIAVNIPPCAESKNGRWVKTLAISTALCATLTACRFEFAVDAGTFAPSVGEIRTLLDQDRVRQALERADLLTQRYRGPEAELVHGWALWRNGDLRGAQARFRRAAESGAEGGYAGLAAVWASMAEWDSAVEMAKIGAVAPERNGVAHAILASAAWVSGDADTAAREMRAWSVAEPGTARGRAAAAMAAAVARLDGPVHEWVGQPTLVPLHPLPGGGCAVDATIGGVRVRMKLDLTFRQSLISSGYAASVGLVADGSPLHPGRAATSRWPALLSPRQAAVSAIDFGGIMVRNVVVAVAEAPADVAGVIGADILTGARWSLAAGCTELMLAPPTVGSRTLEGVEGGQVIAWLKARLVREGVGVQLLLFPRVADSVVAMGLDIGANSRLDSQSFEVTPGSNLVPAQLMLGGWKAEVLWRPASLVGWAVDGGVAPTAVLGSNVLGAWALHWYPMSSQLRVDGPPATF